MGIEPVCFSRPLEVGEIALLDHRPRTATVVSKTPIKIEVIDLGGAHCQDKIAGVEDNAKWGFRNLDKVTPVGTLVAAQGAAVPLTATPSATPTP